jgi:hypothetical protein
MNISNISVTIIVVLIIISFVSIIKNIDSNNLIEEKDAKLINFEKEKVKLITFINKEKDAEIAKIKDDNTKKDTLLNEKESYYNDLYKRNRALTNAVRNNDSYKNYNGCISNVQGLTGFYRMFEGDDVAANNQTRTFWCSPYYTGTVGNNDTRKPTFKI